MDLTWTKTPPSGKEGDGNWLVGYYEFYDCLGWTYFVLTLTFDARKKELTVYPSDESFESWYAEVKSINIPFYFAKFDFETLKPPVSDAEINGLVKYINDLSDEEDNG